MHRPLRDQAAPGWPAGAQLLVAAVWCGAQWTVGYLVAPGLFAWAPDRVTAGMLAGRFFGVVGLVGVAAAAALLALSALRGRLRTRFAALAAAMGLCAALLSFWIQPQAAGLRAQAGGVPVQGTPMAAEFARWHAISSGVYLAESLLGVAMLLAWRRQA